MSRRTALVTGGNQGIGWEVCRELSKQGLAVILSARNVSAGSKAVEEFKKAGLEMRFEEMDVAEDDSVFRCAERLEKAAIAVDVLVNNAAVSLGGGLLDESRGNLQATMNINFTGVMRTCAVFVPGMLERGFGRVVNVSSGCGSFAEGLPGPGPSYSISKAALNAYTRKLAENLRGDVKANVVCPGWVRTRMGGRAAPRSLEQGADSIVWLSTIGADGPNGGFFRDRKPIAW